MRAIEQIEHDRNQRGNQEADGQRGFQNKILFTPIGTAPHAGQQVKTLVFFVSRDAEHIQSAGVRENAFGAEATSHRAISHMSAAVSSLIWSG